MDVGTYAQLQQIQRARLARAKQRPASAPVEPKPRPLRPVNNEGAAGGAAYLPKHKDVATAGPRPKPAVPKNRAMPVSRVSRKKAVPSRVDFAKRPAGDEDEPSDFMRRFPEQLQFGRAWARANERRVLKRLNLRVRVESERDRRALLPIH